MSEPARPDAPPAEDLVPEKLDLRSHTIAEDKREALLRLFPEARTEGGRIDFDRLKLALGETIDTGKERYGLTWPGKAECFKAIQTPSLGTLLPCREESVRFDETENLIIEGDNLEVLKLLQKSYLGKVKMIYIDPPYNTGSDFIYPDDYSESLQTYLQYTGQVDAEGRKFSTNTETSGRFHSKWLSMMYPRLYLARNLLRDDGLILVSIDNTEFASLRAIMDEIYGPENLVTIFVWKRKAGGGDDSQHVALEHEYIFAYARDASLVRLARIEHESPAMTAKYNKSENGRRYYLERLDKTSLTYSPAMDFEIECPDGSRIKPPQPDPNNPTTIWRWSPSTVAERRSELIFERDKNGMWRIYTKTWESLDGVTPRSLLVEPKHGRNRDGTQELSDALGPKIFDNPKPTRLLRHLLEICASEEGSIVLDFFAGSGSTAHAVLEQNTQDGRDRRFILVQLPEVTAREDYSTISAITRARVRRVLERLIASEDETQLSLAPRPSRDLGFRAFKLAESNFRAWNADLAHDAVKAGEQLALHVDHLRPGRSDEDLLYEILLKTGFPLTTPVEKLELAGKRVHAIAGGEMLVCLDRELTLELVRAIGERRPSRVVLLDAGFAGNDQLKANAVKTFESKGVTSFRTV